MSPKWINLVKMLACGWPIANNAESYRFRCNFLKTLQRREEQLITSNFPKTVQRWDEQLITSNFPKPVQRWDEQLIFLKLHVYTLKGLWWCTQSAHQRDYGGAHSLHTKGIMVVHTVCTPKGLWWCTQSAHQRDYGGAHSLHTKGIMVVHTVCTPKGLWWCTQSAHQRDYGGECNLQAKSPMYRQRELYIVVHAVYMYFHQLIAMVQKQ